MVSSIPGRTTLTTTSLPASEFSPKRRAAYTCAMEAAASGFSENSANISLMGCPSCSSISLSAVSVGKGATLSCRFLSSATMSSGIRSGRVDKIWPNLTKIGPKASSARRKRAPRLSLLGTGLRRHGASHSRMRILSGSWSVGTRASSR